MDGTLTERCASPGHWIIGGYSVNRGRERNGSRYWRIRISPDVAIRVESRDAARELIRKLPGKGTAT